MKLPNGLSPQEIRVLQEFRRTEKDELTEEEIIGIKHPGGGGIETARTLLAKGFLAAAPEGSGYCLTDRARTLLAAKPAPAGAVEEPAGESV